MSLGFADILKAALPVKKVSVPKWGGDVYVRTLPAGEMDTLLKKEQTGHRFAAAFCALCLCDESGARLCGDEGADALLTRDTDSLNIVFREAAALNGMSVEDAQKN